MLGVDSMDEDMVTWVRAIEALPVPVVSLLSLLAASGTKKAGFVLLSGAMRLVMTTAVDVKEVGLCASRTPAPPYSPAAACRRLSKRLHSVGWTLRSSIFACSPPIVE